MSVQLLQYHQLHRDIPARTAHKLTMARARLGLDPLQRFTTVQLSLMPPMRRWHSNSQPSSSLLLALTQHTTLTNPVGVMLGCCTAQRAVQWSLLTNAQVAAILKASTSDKGEYLHAASWLHQPYILVAIDDVRQCRALALHASAGEGLSAQKGHLAHRGSRAASSRYYIG